MGRSEVAEDRASAIDTRSETATLITSIETSAPIIVSMEPPSPGSCSRWKKCSHIVGGSVEPMNLLTIPQAVVLGIVEGVTEYLPISSTGHLLIAERLMGLGTTSADKAATDTFTVVIQLGAILAVVGLYRSRLTLMVQGVVGRSDEGRRVLFALLAAFVPAALIGKLLGDTIKERLLAPGPVVAAMALGGVVILVFVRFVQPGLAVITRSITDVSIRQAVIIGIAQVAALWPGTSRSLVTILAALCVGLSLEAAVEFSFLLGLGTLGAATVLELVQNGDILIDTFGWVAPLVGIVTAGISAWISVKWMVGYLQRKPLTIFGWYRIGAAIVAGGLMLGGVI